MEEEIAAEEQSVVEEGNELVEGCLASGRRAGRFALEPTLYSMWLVREEENEEPMSNARFKTEQIPALVSARMNGLTTSEWCRQRVQKCPQTGL